MSHQIQVVIDGTIYSGWKNIRVTRALGSLSGDFSFELVDFPMESTKDINPGESVVIQMGGDVPVPYKLITGYIDRVSRSYDASQTSLVFSGRDKTSDLIDSAAIYPNNYWKRKKVSRICKDICDPFSIDVVLETDDILVDDFTIQSGESAFTAIERLARVYNILLLTDEFGRLKLTQTSQNRSEVRLEVGVNVKTINYEEDHTGRYSQYLAKGQGRGSGNEWTNDIVSLKGESFDDSIERYRPLIFSVEKKMNRTEIQKRVNWEAQVRAGRAVRCNISVLGWLQDPSNKFSSPWAINNHVNVVHKTWGIDSEFIVSSVEFALDNTNGRMTNLELSPPEIFAPEPGKRVKLSNRSSVRPTKGPKSPLPFGPVPITY